MTDRILRMPQVVEMVGLCRASIYNKMRDEAFPRQVKLGRLSGWLESEVQDWIREQIRLSRPDLPTGDRHRHGG
ncbi:MAG: AlpA family transcriptional regulator [Rhodocyclaceae bacterium]|nr:AlpA family transcriptional regulator [Rhodocyclaceae bacterium]